MSHASAQRGTWGLSSERQGQVLLDLAAERDRQDQTWGDQSDHPPSLWLAMLLEEVEEVAEAILAEFVANRTGGRAHKHLREELVHVAAVAVAWVEGLDRRAAGE